MTKYEQIKALQLQINKLTKELEEEEAQKEIERLSKLTEGIPTFRSSKGNIWYKFPADVKLSVAAETFFLTDLKNHYIRNRFYHNNAWQVDNSHFWDEIHAIDYYEREYAN